MTEHNTCKMSLFLYGKSRGGAHIWYDAKNGLRQTLVLSGHIDDPDYGPFGDMVDDSFPSSFPASEFHGRKIRLEIRTWMEDGFVLPDGNHVCGIASIKAGVKPEYFESEGEKFEIEPVSVRIFVNTNAFEGIRCQAEHCSNHHCVMGATITLSDGELPENGKLEKIDLSKDRNFAVTDFEMWKTRFSDFSASRNVVFPVERGSHNAHVSVLVTEATHKKYSEENSLVQKITCEGRIINTRDKSFDAATVGIEFSEFERNQFWELPKNAMFGSFSYWPKQPTEDFLTRFSFDLRYGPDDIDYLLGILLGQHPRARVVLNIDLMCDKQALDAVIEELCGGVWNYSFNVYRDFVQEQKS